MSGKLFIVGTPIGNLGDFSQRAVKTLEDVDFIAAEDTRVTLKLLNHFGIKKEMLSYYEHNKMSRGGEIIARLLSGESCALVSDAGMPAISDPGEELVRLALDEGIAIETVPGPTALTTAIALSGMPSGRFCFEGFLTVNKHGRREHLSELKNEVRTMVFYEAPHKLLATLRDMLSVFGDREIAIVRELTKIHETIRRTCLSEAAEYYSQNPPRGEFVLIIAGKEREEAIAYSLSDAVSIAKKLVEDGEGLSNAAREAAKTTGIKKGDIYKELICS